MPNDKDFELDDLDAFSFDDLSLDDVPAGGEAEDPFGVWVKSAPEDLEGAPLADEAAPPVLAEEDSLSAQELADLDDSVEFVTIDEPMEGEIPLEDGSAFLESPGVPEAETAAEPSFDEVSLDDFVSFDEELGPDAAAADLSVEGELPEAEEDLSEEFLDIDIDIEDDIKDEELEIIEGASPKLGGVEEISLDAFSAEEVDLSEFGDFEEVVPAVEDPLAAEDDLPEVHDLPSFDDLPSLDDLPALEPEAAAAEPDPVLEGLPPLDDLPPLEAHPAVENILGDEDGFFEEEILDDELPLNLEPSDENDLEHIRALEETLTGGVSAPTPEPAPTAAPAAPPVPETDTAALILSKIEQELSSIKSEISALKQEVTHLRSVPAEAPAQPVAPAAAQPAVPAWPSAPEPEETEVPDAWSPEPEAPKKPHGFFDEEDDETIALTGDELDNLLSTAEISEGEEAGLSLEEDLLGLDADGNLTGDFGPHTPEPEAQGSDEVHVTDEEFLAGTALDLNETPVGGVPESIELEEDLDIDPLPEGVLEGPPISLEIPRDEELGLELAEAAPLSPELPADDDLTFDNLPALEDLNDLAAEENEGWSLPPEPPVQVTPLAEPMPVDSPVFTPPPAPANSTGELSPGLKNELRAVLSYMDKLLASLPDDKIQAFAESEQFEVYKRLFEELGLIEQ